VSNPGRLGDGAKQLEDLRSVSERWKSMPGCFVNEFFFFISPVVTIAIGIMWGEKVFQISNFT